MCHIVLSLPVLGLALFYFLPFSQAAPLYGLVLVLSFGVYFLMVQAMRQPVVSGRERMIGETVEALEDFDSEGKVSYGAEIWNARSSEPVRKGQRVVITSMKGLFLTVSAGSAAGKDGVPRGADGQGKNE